MTRHLSWILAAALLAATGVSAQNRAGDFALVPEDAPGAPARAPGTDPVAAPVAAPPAASAPATATAKPVDPAAAAMRQGQADRAAYEAWLESQTGDTLAGASYWKTHPGSLSAAACSGSGSPATGATWTAGCLAAQQKLAAADALRRSSASYRFGWAHPSAYVSDSAPAALKGSAIFAFLTPHHPRPAAATPAAPEAPAASPPERHWRSHHWGAAAIAVGVAILVAGILSLAVYFLPTILAVSRRKRSAGGIFVLNLFLGWSLIGWVVALVWSLSVDPVI